MRASRLIEVLEKLIKEPRWAAFVWGAPGIGKSSIIKAVAAKGNLPVVDLRASLLDPTDLRGLPVVKDGRAVWCPPSFLPAPGMKPGILFLDEINAAPPLVQAAMYQLVLDRRVGEYQLPEGWRIIAAGNRAEDRAVVFRLSSALANRFIHLTLEVDVDCWTDWAFKHQIDPVIIGFIRFRPALLAEKKPSGPAFATPRSWEMASDAIKACGGLKEAQDVLPGIVGEGPAAELIAFGKNAQVTKALEAILEDPEHAPLPTALDQIWAITSCLAAMACKTSQGDKAIETLLSRLPPDFAAVLAKDALKVSPKFLFKQGFRQYMKANASLFSN